MHRFLLFVIIMLHVVGCTNTPGNSTREATSAEPANQKVTGLPWATAIDTRTGNTQLQRKAGNTSGITYQQVIDAANKKYPDIRLEWIKQQGQTAYLKITDATYLTQSMGSAGAEAYLSEVTYSLTEVEGIDSVNLNFDEGDHAAPGIYTRDQFKSLVN